MGACRLRWVAPEHAEVHIDTTVDIPADAVDRLVAYLRSVGIIPS